MGFVWRRIEGCRQRNRLAGVPATGEEATIVARFRSFAKRATRGKSVEINSPIGLKRGNPDVSARRIETGSPSGAPGRTLLAPQGPWLMVNPEGRNECRRGPQHRRHQGVHGRDGRCTHGTARATWRD